MEHLWFHHITKKRSPKEALDAELKFAESKGYMCLRPFPSACKIIANVPDGLMAKKLISSDEAEYPQRLQDLYVPAKDTKDLMWEYRQIPARFNVKPRIQKSFKVPILQPDEIGTTRGTNLLSSGFEGSEVEHATGETPSWENKDGTSLAPTPAAGSGFYDPATHWSMDYRATNALDLHTTRREAKISLPTGESETESEIAVSEADWGKFASPSPEREMCNEEMDVESSAGSSKDLQSSIEEKKEKLRQKLKATRNKISLKSAEVASQEKIAKSKFEWEFKVQKEILDTKIHQGLLEKKEREVVPPPPIVLKSAAKVHQEKMEGNRAMERGEVAPEPQSIPEPKANPQGASSIIDRKENLIRRWRETPRGTRPKTDHECIVC